MGGLNLFYWKNGRIQKIEAGVYGDQLIMGLRDRTIASFQIIGPFLGPATDLETGKRVYPTSLDYADAYYLFDPAEYVPTNDSDLK